MTGEVLDRFSQLITTALGLVAALAWNTAIQNLFDRVFGKAGAALAGQFLYAILITLGVIFATIAVSRAAEKAKKTKPSNKPKANRARHPQLPEGALREAPKGRYANP